MKIYFFGFFNLDKIASNGFFGLISNGNYIEKPKIS